MTVRKQILVAVFAALATPLVASAATPETWYAPLSTWKTIEQSTTSNSAADDVGTPTSYPLLSYSAQPSTETVAKTSTGTDSGNRVDYALSSYATQLHNRG